MGVAAYELLYRPSSDACGAGVVDAAADAQSLANSLVEIGLDKLVGSVTAFVNVSESLLHSEALRLLPKGRVVLELLENLSASEATLEAVRDLKKRGYIIALDDFVFAEGQEHLLEFADFVKVDVLGVDLKDVSPRLKKLRKSGIRLLAEKVETHEVHRQCLALGFELFQGYFFAKPDIVSGRVMPPNRMSLVQLLTRVTDPDVTFDELERVVSLDVGLSYRLLRVINSASMGISPPISTIRQALMFLGLQRVVALTSLLVLSSMSDKPHELMVTALVRAKLSEDMSVHLGFKNPRTHFTTGLLSVVDAFIDQPMAEIVDELPLSLVVKGALTGSDPGLETSQCLSSTLAIEHADWDRIPLDRVEPEKISEAYISALVWAQQSIDALAA